MPVKGTVMVRNLRKGPTVLGDPQNAQGYIMWGGYNSPDGSDIMPLSEEKANSPEFNRALRRGIFEIIDDEQANEAQDRQVAEYQRQVEERAAQIHSVVDNEADKDIAALECVGPDERGQMGKCGQTVVVSKKQDSPPLCTKHSHMSGQFVAIDTWGDAGRTVKWSHTTIER